MCIKFCIVNMLVCANACVWGGGGGRGVCVCVCVCVRACMRVCVGGGEGGVCV